MTACPHCHGTGQESDPRALPITQRRALPRRMIPFGNEAAAALRAGTLTVAPCLFAGMCPNTHKDAWTLAREHIAQHGPGSALVLPEGESIEGYRLPALPLFPPCDVALVVFAYGWSSADCERAGRVLVDNGLNAVHILGGESGPLELRVR